MSFFFWGGGTHQICDTPVWALLLASFATTKLVIALVSVAKRDKRLLKCSIRGRLFSCPISGVSRLVRMAYSTMRIEFLDRALRKIDLQELA